MNQERLTKNIIDQIVESQIKLGFVKETVRLYYPVESLNHLLEVDTENETQMLAILTETFREQSDLAAFSSHKGRIEISVLPKGVEYIHEHIEQPPFLVDIIHLFQEHHHCSLQEIQEVFSRYSKDYVCEKMPQGSDFDYVLYFKDDAIDEYCYCIKMEMGHTIYHRFTKEDYQMLLVG